MARTGRPRTVYLPMDEIRELTAQGWRMGELAKRYGCSKDLVWKRMKESGIPRHPQHSQPGDKNPSWKGGKYLDGDGYILVYAPDHPHATKAGRVREHRLVMERVLGRYLEPDEVVDHIDGNKQNNNPSNLRVFRRNNEHLKETLRGRIPKWTPEGMRSIRESAKRPRPPVSQETRHKMSKVRKGKPWSEKRRQAESQRQSQRQISSR